MFISSWQLHIDADDLDQARLYLQECLDLLVKSPSDSAIGEYQLGGYMADLQFLHADLQWQQAIYQVMQLAQRLGSGWLLTGDIEGDPEASLSPVVSAATNHPHLLWVQWQMSRSPHSVN